MNVTLWILQVVVGVFFVVSGHGKAFNPWESMQRIPWIDGVSLGLMESSSEPHAPHEVLEARVRAQGRESRVPGHEIEVPDAVGLFQPGQGRFLVAQSQVDQRDAHR